MSYAVRTDVPIAQSRAEIERTVSRYGADQFIYGTMDQKALNFTADGADLINGGSSGARIRTGGLSYTVSQILKF